MREFLNKFGIVVAVVAVVIAGVVVWLHYKQPGIKVDKSPLTSYVDEDSSEESMLSIWEVPPLGNSEGRPIVVRLVKITFDGGVTSKPHYLLKYNEQAQLELQKMKNDDPRRAEVAANGELIRLPAPGSEWVAGNSERAKAIRELPKGPDGKMAEVVGPKTQ